MTPHHSSLHHHRVAAESTASVRNGRVRYAPVKSLWFIGMASGALIGGLLTFSWQAFALFIVATGAVLLLGHSLGSHRKLIHNSYQCPKWLEYFLVYCGVQVGLAGPIGLMRQHELRDFAQRLDDCHDYLRHGREFWVDAWWQLNCELELDTPPVIRIEPSIANDRFYQFLEQTWMIQQLPLAVLLWWWGGWAFVFWGVCARVTAGVFGHWFIGYFAHNQGGMHIEVRGAAVQGRNVRWVSLLTMGEGWHNNHHAYPGSARLGLFPGEWDPGWWVLSAMEKLGLVWGIRLPEDLPARTELVGRDALGRHQLETGKAVGPSVPVLQGWAMIRFACAALFRTSAGKSHSDLKVCWPELLLSRVAMRKLLGSTPDLQPYPWARRFEVSNGRVRLQGLPAFLLALGWHRPLISIAALVALPLAALFEMTRAELFTGSGA